MHAHVPGIYDLQTKSYFQNKAKSTTLWSGVAWKLLFLSLLERNKTAKPLLQFRLKWVLAARRENTGAVWFSL